MSLFLVLIVLPLPTAHNYPHQVAVVECVHAEDLSIILLLLTCIDGNMLWLTFYHYRNIDSRIGQKSASKAS